MSPTEELRAAAAVLRHLSAAARAKTMPGPGNGDEWLPWSFVRDHIKLPGFPAEPTGGAFVAHPRFAHNHEEAWEEAAFITEAIPAPIAEWMALVHPGLAEPLAVWLDWAAQMQADGEYVASRLGCEPDSGRYMGLDRALAVARYINGTFPPSSSS